MDIGATLASWCYVMNIESTTGLCMLHKSMKQLSCLESKLSQGTFVLEKWLILSRHFILQFP